MDAQTQEKLKKMEKRTQIWLDVETDNWSDDTKARWIINRVPELLQLVREQETQLNHQDEIIVKMDGHLVRNGLEIIEKTNEKAELEYQLEVCKTQLSKYEHVVEAAKETVDAYETFDSRARQKLKDALEALE
jgi:succinyl-CoA synthetase beta subunit